VQGTGGELERDGHAVLIPTEEFAVDLGSSLRWGKPSDRVSSLSVTFGPLLLSQHTATPHSGQRTKS
jgi:hypothetical protein